jgi:DNA (cytosine-5)-methyltransferase 1
MKYFSMFSGIGGFELGIQRAFSCDREQQTDTKISPQDSSISPEIVKPNKPKVGRNNTCIGYSEIDKYAIKVYERQFNGNTGDKCTDATCGQTEPNKNMLQVRQRETISALSRNNSRIGNVSENGGSVLPTDIGRIRTICNECGRQKGHRNYGDATAINPAKLPDFDLLVGGFPCQAFSIAGKRKGFNDTRGTLFFDIARILAEKRPRHLVLENVKGLLSHDSGKTFQTILGVLSDLGYRVEWQVLNSKDFGVPQNRERIYFVGHLRGECAGEVFPITNTHRPNTEPVQRHISNTLTARYEAAQATGTYIGESQLNAQKVKSAATRTRAYAGKPEALEIRDDEVSNTINSVTKDYYATDMARIRRLTPLECERLQGFPDDWTKQGIEPCVPDCISCPHNKYYAKLTEISDTQRYKMCGNAVTVNTVQAVMEKLIKHEEV